MGVNRTPRFGAELLRTANMHVCRSSLKKLIASIEDLALNSRRPSVRYNAAKWLIEHERDLAKHEDGQKLTIKNVDPITEFTVKIVNPPSETPPQENG
jgi:hypothetical protein